MTFSVFIKITVFYSKVEESATFVYFFTTYNAGPDITPIVLLSNRRLRIKI